MARKTILLASGTRGDILPYTALARGLKESGQEPLLVTHPAFAGLAASQGIPFASLGDNPTDLMTRPGNMPLTFSGNPLASLQATFAYLQAARPLYRAMFHAAWSASQDARLLIVGLPTFWGESLVEAMGIPLVWAPLQPLTPTGDFASAMLPFRTNLARPLNHLSHRLVMRFTRLAWLSEINAWRRSKLSLPPIEWHSPAPAAPYLYGISRHVMRRPHDWPADHHLTGFWFTSPPTDYQPPDALQHFLDAGEPPVYIGFGSMAQPGKLVSALVEAARMTRMRIITALPVQYTDLSLPANLLLLNESPHGWLFPRLRAAIHHGGAGTTAASLRAGLPTAITPVGVDQFFWGERVWKMGAGPKPVPQRSLTASRLAALLDDLSTNSAYRASAAAIGEDLRAEDGVGSAVAHLSRILDQYC